MRKSGLSNIIRDSYLFEGNFGSFLSRRCFPNGAFWSVLAHLVKVDDIIEREFDWGLEIWKELY